MPGFYTRVPSKGITFLQIKPGLFRMQSHVLLYKGGFIWEKKQNRKYFWKGEFGDEYIKRNMGSELQAEKSLTILFSLEVQGV